MIRALAAAVAAATASIAFASATPGAAAPAFTLTDLSGKPVNLADYRGRTVVLEWHNFGCPFVQKHYRSGNMQALQKKYGKDVAWLAVNSTARTAFDYAEPAAIASDLKRFDAQPARYLMDTPGEVGLAYGAKTTPHMFVIDDKGTLVYAGAIDDKASTDKADVEGATNYVRAAYQETKAGQPVKTPSTAPYGCSVKYSN